jgi:hypothetical protein
MALRPAGKTLSSLTGVVVLAATLWLLLNFVYAPGCGRFSCSYEPSWWPRAEADAGGRCPGSWQEAVGDEGWLRDRLESISDTKITTGLAYDEDGELTTFVSGRDEDAETALKAGWGSGAIPPNVRPTVVDHVEVKVAAAMRQSGATRTLLIINQPSGPCSPDASRPYTCTKIVPRVLAVGMELVVVWKDHRGWLRELQFVGEA